MEKYRVTLTLEERQGLEIMISTGTAAARKLTHARLLLLCDESDYGPSLSDAEVSEALHVSERTISRARQRFVCESLEAALSPRAQPDRPGKVKIKGDTEQALLELACSDPPAGTARWTLQLLAGEMVAMGALQSVSIETVRQALHKHEVRPWIVKKWCIPPKANAAYVCAMEDVLQTYALPEDKHHPVICMDEVSRQLVGEIREPTPAQRATPDRPGVPRHVDGEYERKGVCNLFVWCEPRTGKRHVKVTDQRTAKEWALFIAELAEVHYPDAEKIHLVMDNLSTHTLANLYKVFEPERAREIAGRLMLHYTPVHGSWLNMAEIEIGILARQCLDRRIESREKMEAEVRAWQERRNQAEIKIHWTFTLAAARQKLHRLYPSIEA